jgi:tape measure domain-containing protein
MAAPELRLDVRLNLATFRTDLGKAAQAAAAYYYPINLLINKQNLTKQLTAIGRSLGTTKYNINLNDTSVDLAAGKIDKLAASLKKLSGSIQIDFNAGGGTKPIGTAMKEMAAKLAKESKGDINRAVEQMTGMRGASPFGAGTRSIPGFKAAAKGMGIENAFKLFFQELQQVDPQSLKKALDDGSVMMMQENRELKQKFNKIQSSAEGLAQDLRAMGETAKATGKASLTTDGKTLYPQNYGLKIASLLSQVEKLDKDLRRISMESGGELLDTLTELSSVLRTTSNSFVGIAGFSKNLDETLRGFDVATKAATRATTAYADRITRRGGGPAEATAGPRLLSGRDPGGALVAPLRDDPYRVIQAQVKNAFDIIEDYHKRQSQTFINGYKKIIEDHHRKILVQVAKISEYRPAQKLLSGTPPRLALPPVGGASTPERRVRITTGAYLGQPSMMRAPSVPPSMGGGGGAPPIPPRGGGGGGSFGGMQFNVPQLPGAGLVREIGTEFGFAAKQVLLFGTAYKALAFIQGFPAQVGEAVGALQSFRNTIGEISPSAQEAAESSQFILDIVEKYNTPLQSARDGFVKLYASMQPAGFSGDEIRDLFLGISQTAATFGMSAEKVDRVNYAFAQMASKGQVMSEELKGQLGDVLPGAMGIFAEAAGFKGPEAITKFSKALEDGAYKGAAMKTLLTNVGIVMRKEFGPGAEGAARTFQGVINRMQNSFKLLYESFEPVAVGFLNSVVVPMTSGLKTVTDGFNAFFTGQAAQTAGGSVFAKQLEALRPAFEGIAANIKQVLPLLQSFGNTALSVGKVLLQVAGNPFVGYLGRAYLSVLPLTIAIQALNLQALIPLIRNLLGAAPAFIAFTAAQARGLSTTASFRGAVLGLGQTAAATGVQIRLLSGIIKTAFASTVIGIAILGIGMLIEKLVMSGIAADQAKQKMLQFADAVKAAGKAGDVAGVTATLSAEKAIAGRIKAAQNLLEQLKTGKASVSRSQAEELRNLGLASNLSFMKESGQQNLTVQAIPGAISANIAAAQQGYLEAQTKIVQSQRALNEAKSLQAKEEKEIQTINNTEEPSAKDLLKSANTLNQLLQRELELQTRLGNVDKDALSQLEAKADLAKQILKLTIEDIRANETGAIQAQAITNAVLEYRAVVAELNDDWQNAINSVSELGKETNQLYKNIMEQRGLEGSPLAEAIKDVNKDTEDAIEKIDELLKRLKKTVGSRPEGLEVRGALGSTREDLSGMTMERKTLLASQKIAGPVTKDLQNQIIALQNAGKSFTTLDEIILKIGDDWGNLSPKVRDDITAMAQQVDLLRPYAEVASAIKEARDNLTKFTSASYISIQSGRAIGNAFGEAFKGIITGSMTAQQALAGMFQNIANYFADMVAQMIAEWLKALLIKGFMSLFPGGSALASGFSGSAAGFGGSFDAGIPAIGNTADFSGAFKFANGGIAAGGFTAFANGGIVTGPTLGLVGEGKYNEAVIPLPDGKSVPVQLSGGDGGNQINSNITVNVSNGQAQSNASGSNSSELGRKIEGAVKQVIVGELRPGGLLASR